MTKYRVEFWSGSTKLCHFWEGYAPNDVEALRYAIESNSLVEWVSVSPDFTVKIARAK